MGYPKVEVKDAQGFGKVWHHNGVGIILNDSHFKFATDYANVVLRNFVDMQVAQVEAQEKREAEAKKKTEIVLA